MSPAWHARAVYATIPPVMGRPPLSAVPAPGDGELVARAVAGEAWARETLYHRHAGAVAGVLVRLLGAGADAEDALQDTFVTALHELARLRERDAVRPWLLRIAARQAHRRFRRRRLLRLLGLDRGGDSALAALAAPATSPETRAELALLDRALAALPPGPRIAWSLRFVEGYDLEAVAAACGCSLATAKRRIAAAQAQVGRHVDLCGWSDE
ncbi:MAG TPA: RNA polymerase sigma factor [Polyangia bacterium]|jgi:RNA polymerase sigma-70 factor (ECF subfamily)